MLRLRLCPPSCDNNYQITAKLRYQALVKDCHTYSRQSAVSFSVLIDAVSQLHGRFCDDVMEHKKAKTDSSHAASSRVFKNVCL